MQLRWAKLAREEYLAQIDYVGERNLEAAYLVQERIDSAVEKIFKFPEIGRIGRRDGTREFKVFGTSVMVVYGLEGDVFWIYNILHTSRRYPYPRPRIQGGKK